MTLDAWVRAHPFLEPLARLQARIDASIEASAVTPPSVPAWSDYREDFAAGVPLLHSPSAGIDLEPAAGAIARVTARLAADPLDRGDDMRVVAEEVTALPAPRLIDWLLGDDDREASRPGPLRYVGWLVMAAWLKPVVAEFDACRDDDRWLRRYCPTCGSLPAMAQLLGSDPGRRRFLSCGCCGTRWRYSRTGCPFCEVEAHRLASLGVDGEGGLRIDYCESCRAYLKTYDGHGSEDVFLADWTSLHLDLAARDRGLQRAAASLYDLDSTSAPH